jgi:uncharacterized protein YdbL (DUF1318 family)
MLVIPKADQYLVGGVAFFKLQGPTNVVYRDMYTDLSKNSVSSLKRIAKVAGLKGFSTMKKDDLVNNLNGLVIFQ